ncbi:unnamed protein product [Spirodela intermedia]|nr:unnamed protein product [Spirodela intermedia]CAA6665458.1 unnamed protein product [Spirodela intermedia]
MALKSLTGAAEGTRTCAEHHSEGSADGAAAASTVEGGWFRTAAAEGAVVVIRSGSLAPMSAGHMYTSSSFSGAALVEGERPGGVAGGAINGLERTRRPSR